MCKAVSYFNGVPCFEEAETFSSMRETKRFCKRINCMKLQEEFKAMRDDKFEKLWLKYRRKNEDCS